MIALLFNKEVLMKLGRSYSLSCGLLLGFSLPLLLSTSLYA